MTTIERILTECSLLIPDGNEGRHKLCEAPVVGTVTYQPINTPWGKGPAVPHRRCEEHLTQAVVGKTDGTNREVIRVERHEEIGAPHVWMIFEGDAGPVGAYDYNECVVCGAQGGACLSWKNDQPWFARVHRDDIGHAHLDLPMDDCDASLRSIARWNADHIVVNETQNEKAIARVAADLSIFYPEEAGAIAQAISAFEDIAYPTEAMDEAIAFYEKLRATFAEGRKADGIDLVYQTLDDWCYEGPITYAAHFLAVLSNHIEDLPLSVSMSALVATRARRRHHPRLASARRGLVEALMSLDKDWKALYMDEIFRECGFDMPPRGEDE